MKRLLLFYVLGLPFGFLLFWFGFRLGLFGSDTILFYRGLKIIAVAAVLQWAALSLAAHFQGGVSQAHAFAVTMANIAVSVCFLIVIPVSLDRSVSVFMLGYMENMRRPLTHQEMEDALVDIYIKDYGAVSRRIAEQSASGNVIIEPDGRFRLSPQGADFVRWSKLLGPTFNLDMRYLDPPVKGGDKP